MRHTTQYRDGNTMICATIETHPAVIDFADILAHCKVELDEYFCDKPWDNCDGYEHTLRDATDNESHYAASNVILYGRRDKAIDLQPDVSLFKWYRANGASRQTAAEACAQEHKRRMNQLKAWYRDGWTYYTASCEYLDESDSCGGIDDEDYAAEVAQECAGNVAYQLIKAGYTIENMPSSDRAASYRQNRIAHIRQNLHIGNWQ